MSNLPKGMRQDFLLLFLHLKCGSPIGESSRLRLLKFIQENMPAQKATSSDLDKMHHHALVNEAIKLGYKTGNSSQSDSAFYIAANSSSNPVGEATVKNHYYKIKKLLEDLGDTHAAVLKSAQPMPAPPDDYVGPVIYVEGREGNDKTESESKIITYAGVFIYNNDTQLTEKIRDVNESDLLLLSEISGHMDSDGDD